MAFNNHVTTACSWDELDDQVRKKVNEIAEDGGRGTKGLVNANIGAPATSGSSAPGP